MYCDFYLLFVNQCSEMIFCKDVAGHLLQVFGGEAVDVTHDVAEVTLLSAVQVVTSPLRSLSDRFRRELRPGPPRMLLSR